MTTGTVKFFNQSKGFGFITPDNGGKDVFVHQNSVRGPDLSDGCKVQFDTEQSPKGLNAINVERID
jgi:CspA family cold shock protein